MLGGIGAAIWGEELQNVRGNSCRKLGGRVEKMYGGIVAASSSGILANDASRMRFLTIFGGPSLAKALKNQLSGQFF